NNRIYVANGANLYAIDLDTGGNIWPPYLAVGNIESSPAIGSNGVIYVGDSGGNLHAIDPADGTTWWDAPLALGGVIISSPLVDANNIIYVGNDDGNVYAYQDDGQGNPPVYKWLYLTDGPIGLSSPALSNDGTLYIGSSDKKLYALSNDGEMTDPYAKHPQPMFRNNIKRTGQTRFLGPLSPFPNFSTPTGGPVRSSPAIDKDGIIYVGDNSGYINAYYPDGLPYWSDNVGAPIRSSPAIGLNNTVYFGADNGWFCAYTITGTRKWVYPTGNS
ncbi:unnamed protein product, partial [marine sediment metagenome]